MLHADKGDGFRHACQRARGRVIVLADARTDAPLAAVGYALGRLRDGLDVVALGGRYLVLRRTRAWRAFDALVGRRDAKAVETPLFPPRAPAGAFVHGDTSHTRAAALVVAAVRVPRLPRARRLIAPA